MSMDIRDLIRQFGFGDDDTDEIMQDPQIQSMIAQPELQQALENPQIASLFGKVGGMLAQGGIMPDDVDSLLSDADAMGGLETLLGGGEYDEIDLDEAAAAYQPAAEDAADRKFADALKSWIAQTVQEIPARDVCMLEIGFHAAFDETDQVRYEIWLAYNTEETRWKNRERFGTEVWNWINWTDGQFRLLPDEPFAAWRQSQGYDEDNDGDEMIARIYDLAAVAVTELHSAQLTEQIFGKKIPFIIEDFEYSPQTAVRAVKVNGAELFDKQFFADCGFADDDEEDTESSTRSAE